MDYFVRIKDGSGSGRFSFPEPDLLHISLLQCVFFRKSLFFNFQEGRAATSK